MATSLYKPVLCPVLIGRSAQLDTLHQLIDNVKQSPRNVALIAGEAGIGKSRLAAEGRAYALDRGFLVFQGACFPQDTSSPYAPLLDLLRSQFAYRGAPLRAADLDATVRELLQLLPGIIPLPAELAAAPSLDPEAYKRRLFAALTHYFTRYTAEQPVLLLFEDVHWSDDTSLEFVQRLAQHSVGQPLLVLATYRSDEASPRLRQWLAQIDRMRLGQEITLARLSRDEVATMLRAIFDLSRPVRAEFLDTIYPLTEGNPFFIEELLTSLVAAGDIFYSEGGWDRKPLNELSIPRSVQDAVQQRVRLLSQAACTTLTLAAAIGRRFDFALLQALTHHNESDLIALIKEGIAAQLVIEESADRFAFRHALTRQAIYGELLARERRALHRRIAETIETIYAGALDAHAAELGYHYFAAGAWQPALSFAWQAGDQAQTIYAPLAAIEHYTRALEAARHLSIAPSARLHRDRGLAYETLGDFDHARADHEMAYQLARSGDNRQDEWQALNDLGFLWTARDYHRAGKYFQQALELARTLGDPPTLAHSLNRLGNWHLNVEEPEVAQRYHAEALAIFETLSDRRGVAETLDLLGMSGWVGGDLVQSMRSYERAYQFFAELDDQQALAAVLAAFTFLDDINYQTDTLVIADGRLVGGAQAAERSLAIARRIGWRSGEAFTLWVTAFVAGMQGDYTQALAYARSSLQIAEEIEHRQWVCGALNAMGSVLADVYALDQARVALDRALAFAQDLGSVTWICISTGFLAACAVAQGDLDYARARLDDIGSADAPLRTMGQRCVGVARALLALASDEPERALGIVDRLYATARNLPPDANQPGGIPRLSMLRGEALLVLGNHAAALAALLDAQRSAEALGARSLLWRIHLLLGKVYRAADQPGEAAHAFTQASAIVHELAEAIPDMDLREGFLAHATTLLPQPADHASRLEPRETPDGLTAREREVVALVAQGKSNREIADTLVVAERTVETHVSNILGKLGFSRRGQIAAWAVAHGLVSP
jgi:DNA-binding CsgD family transcriptional regulator/tetratricopeptide (TPR) repeat protein